MRKNCDTCKHDEFGEKYCDDCYHGKNGNPPTKWEAADYYEPDTNAEHIRNMNDEQLAAWISGGALCSDSVCRYCKNNKENLCNPVDCKDRTDAEIILEWLKRPVEE